MGIIPSIKVKNGGFAGTVEMEPAGQECWNHDTDTPVANGDRTHQTNNLLCLPALPYHNVS